MYSKQQEIQALKNLLIFSGEYGYLSQMFTPELVNHIEQQIGSDFAFIDHTRFVPDPPKEEVSTPKWEQYLLVVERDVYDRIGVYDNDQEGVEGLVKRIAQVNKAGRVCRVHGYAKGHPVTELHEFDV